VISNQWLVVGGYVSRRDGVRWVRDGGVDVGKQGISIDWLL